MTCLRRKSSERYEKTSTGRFCRMHGNEKPGCEVQTGFWGRYPNTEERCCRRCILLSPKDESDNIQIFFLISPTAGQQFPSSFRHKGWSCRRVRRRSPDSGNPCSVHRFPLPLHAAFPDFPASDMDATCFC